MALACKMMQGGLSAGAAKSINGDVQPAVSAAGTTIADATRLTAGVNVLTTVASGAGVQLFSAEIGDEQEILNLGANQCLVYPDSTSGRINQLSAGTAFTLAANTAVKVKKFSATRWMAWLSA